MGRRPAPSPGKGPARPHVEAGWGGLGRRRGYREERERRDEPLRRPPRPDIFERPRPEDRPARRRDAALRLPPLRPISE